MHKWPNYDAWGRGKAQSNIRNSTQAPTPYSTNSRPEDPLLCLALSETLTRRCSNEDVADARANVQQGWLWVSEGMLTCQTLKETHDIDDFTLVRARVSCQPSLVYLSGPRHSASLLIAPWKGHATCRSPSPTLFCLPALLLEPTGKLS